ncbi:MAG: DUF11 domain-containing protein, partial [Verrucomicrobia bacterium]|nr:DUF11 domain-containing protein [Verrucomicrobiota bacterium]
MFLLPFYAAQAAFIVHEFFLPIPEQQLYTTLNTIRSGIGITNFSTFSIVVTGDGTVIHYDQWEDGYEVNLGSPVQASTKIWGDGNNANGIAPGFVNDPSGLPTGTVITLTNNVPLPRNPSVILYDARDRFGGTKALAVSRAGWPVPTGPVFGGALMVPATLDYGTNYVAPVGQDMTNGLFEYVGLFVMAGQDGTLVTIDTDGPVGATAPFNVTLNRGESYHVNGTVKKGGTVVSSKPVQTDMIIGNVGASYAADWFTLFPVEDWSSTYASPVATANSGNPSYLYLFNNNPTNITINYVTRTVSGSFTVAASNGVFQFQMPKLSGAAFTSVGGAKFFAIGTVGANPAADTAYNWGYTPVPKDSLTTEAVLGWGPGSANLTVNGSPVWVTPLAATTIYVDYNGDKNGPLTDVNGDKYDTNFTLAFLESKRIFDPDKDQTGMRVYTLDGTLISVVWGEDPDTASPGNPYIDAGTSVLPFPVPTVTKTAVITNDLNPPGLSIGDTIEYAVTVDNRGLLPLANVVVIDLPAPTVTYVTNSTYWNGTNIADNTSGTAFPIDSPGFTVPIILRNGTSTFKYRFLVVSNGSADNTVSIGGTKVKATATVPPVAGSTQCVVRFTDSGGNVVSSYTTGDNLYVTITDNDANTSSNSIQSISLTVTNSTRGDYETLTLYETTTNSGIFLNTNFLAISSSLGTIPQDGTMNALGSDVLTVGYKDPIYLDTDSTNITVQAAANTKILYLSGAGQNLTRTDPVAAGSGPTRESALLGSTTGVIGIAATNSTFATNSSVTLAHNPGTGPNRLLIVTVGIGNNIISGSAPFVTNITFNGANMTFVGSNGPPSGFGCKTFIYSLTNPPSGSANVVVGASANSTMGVGAITFTNVDQTTPLGTYVGNSAGSGATGSNVVTSATNEVVVSVAAWDDGGTAQVVNTNSAGMTKQWSYALSFVGTTTSTKAGAASVTNGYTTSDGTQEWSVSGVPVKPAVGSSGATNFTTFTQTPNFGKDFVIRSNTTLTITNFLKITNGTMPGSPAITAYLMRIGTTTNVVLTLTNPTYTGSSSSLVWQTTSPTNITFTNGQSLRYIISNAQSSVAYYVQYDSTNRPSKILLPTSTIITVESLGVYDAPYPGGSLVLAPNANALVYVRAQVSDPFGTNDITSVGLSITAPTNTANVSTTLTNSHVVATPDSATKIYEYAWQTTTTLGVYNLLATAHEGTEGITNTATASVEIVFNDLGTPGTTVFTSGDNGPATNSFAANTNVCVRVNDADQNTDNSVVETVTATITSSSGDSELLTLTETSTNSGIFTACITASTTLGTGNDNGTLLAPEGAVLSVAYTDPTDPSDTSSAGASIPAATPSVSVVKTLSSPTSGQASVGDTITYNIQVANNGNSTLTNLVVTDTYHSGLQFTNATPSPSTTNTGTRTLTWTNLGTFPPGHLTNITVNFTGTNSAAPATNSATGAATGATNSSTVNVTITQPQLTIIKSLLNPTSGPVSIGSNITFRIFVTNSGSATITSLPLQDTFSAAYFQYTNATTTPDGVGAGSLFWADLTGAGSLAPGGAITIDVTFLVVGAGSPANNTAFADFAVDSNGNTVPTATSTVGVTTLAATLQGAVYYDADVSGTLTAGDSALAGVTIQLYTDPNADGNPADGTLVQQISTLPDGSYELLNLTTGAYVVVETDPSGFASSFPANNRIATNITSLATFTNLNFFDYVPAVTNYVTINGRVIEDTNLNQAFNVGEPGVTNVVVDLYLDANTNGVVDLGESLVTSTLTTTNGAYSFANLAAGAYVVVEVDPAGYTVVADTTGANDNMIGVVLTNGVTTNDNNFLLQHNLPPANITPGAQTVMEDSTMNFGSLVSVEDADSTNLTVTLTVTNGVIRLSQTNGLTFSVGSGTNATMTFSGSTNSIQAALTNLVYAPTTNFNGNDVLVITSTDPGGLSDTDNVFITVTPEVNPLQNLTTIPAGSWVIPMDTNLQSIATTYFNLKAYGCANMVLQNYQPLMWAIRSGKGKDEMDFTATNVSRLFPTTSATITTNFYGGPFIIHRDYVPAISNVIRAFAMTNSVAVYLMGEDTLVDIRYTLTHRPFVAINSVNFNIHEGYLLKAGFTNLDHYAEVADTSVLSNSCFTLYTEPHTDQTNGVGNVHNYVRTGGNFLPQCESVLTFENHVNGRFQTTLGIVKDNTSTTLVYSHHDLPYNQFHGPLSDNVGGSVRDWHLAAGSVFTNSGHVDVFHTPESTNFRASSAKVYTNGPGGEVFFLGGHDYNGTSWENINGMRMYMNAVFVPATRPGCVGLTLLSDLTVTKTGPSNVTAGTNFTYTITVTNLGPSPAINISVTDSLPTGLTFVSATPANIITNGSQIIWTNLGTLLTNGSTNLTLTVTAPVFPTAGSLTNTASVGSGIDDPNSTNSTSTSTVAVTNSPPTLNTIANVTILEDAGLQAVTLSGITEGTNQSAQTLTLTATSSDTGLVPNPPITFTEGQTTATLNYTPSAGSNGVVTVTVVVQDNGGTANGGVDATTNTFTVTITPVNDPPTLDTIANITVTEDAGAQNVSLSGISEGPANEAAQALTFTATSSNTGLIPNPSITFTENNATGTLTYTSVTNASGTVTITVIVQDNGGTANGGVDAKTNTFTIVVTPVNDPPVVETNGVPGSLGGPGPGPYATNTYDSAVWSLSLVSSFSDVETASLYFT